MRKSYSVWCGQAWFSKKVWEELRVGLNASIHTLGVVLLWSHCRGDFEGKPMIFQSTVFRQFVCQDPFLKYLYLISLRQRKQSWGSCTEQEKDKFNNFGASGFVEILALQLAEHECSCHHLGRAAVALLSTAINHTAYLCVSVRLQSVASASDWAPVWAWATPPSLSREKWIFRFFPHITFPKGLTCSLYLK